MTHKEIDEILDELQAGKKHYIDDYFGGEDLTFGYDTTVGRFYIQRIDTIVGSYNTTTFCTIEEIAEILRRY